MNSATWQRDRIVAVIDRDFRNRIELRELDTPPDAVGERLGEGFAPAVSSRGALAYVRVGESRKRRLVDEVVRLNGRRREVLAQRHLIWDLFWIGRRLVAFSESRSGRATLVEVTRRVAIMQLGGTHRRVFRRSWIPWAWSPDGRRVLVGQSSQVGLVNPDTGKVESLGRLPCGYMSSAERAPPGAHTWP